MNFLSNNIYIELINNINEAVILHDKYGNILDANKYACDNLDYKKEELLKLKIFDIEKAYSKSYLLKLWNNFDDNFKVVKGIHQDKNKNSHQVSVKVGLIDKDKKIFFVITKYKEHKLAKDAYQNYDVILTILQEVFIKQKKIKLENLGDFILEKIKSFIQFDYGCILIFGPQSNPRSVIYQSYKNNNQIEI